MVAASVKPYRLQRKTTLFKGGFLLDMKGNGKAINVIQKEIQIGSELK